MSYPKLIENLLDQLSKLPGIGRRSAERMVFWMLNQEAHVIENLCTSMLAMKRELQFCRICNHLSDTDTCRVCSDDSRDRSIICVVENPKDVLAIESTGAFNGVYHVLLGSIAPAEGRGPDQIKINQLLGRLNPQTIQEVVIATDADSEGEMTALYLLKKIKERGVKASRIGLGIPMGSSVEFADASTLGMSMKARRVLTEG